MTKDPQKNKFLLTINNPDSYGITHESIKKTLIENFTTLEFFCMADEIGGETNTYHIHLFIFFTSRVRFSTVKKRFPEAHIDAVTRGTTKDIIDYIKKQGKWRDTEKSETSVKGTYEEWGTLPPDKGVRNDLADLYQMILEGMTNAEIIAENQDYILLLDKLDKVRTTVLTEEYKNKRRLDLEVVYISGHSGAGKTRSVLDEFGDANVYRTSDYKNPFDGYACQPVLLLDEFRSQLKISSLLDYLDIYPIELPARYANKYACYSKVFIVSNWALEDQYCALKHEDPESLQALYRRIHKVKIFDKSGSIYCYDGVKNYFNHILSSESTLKDINEQEIMEILKR